MTNDAARLARIDRFPIKSIGGEALASVTLNAGQPLPGDRRFAVMHAGATHHLSDGALTKWLPKSAFLRGAAAAPLQAIRGGWEGDVLVLTHPDRPALRFDPATGEAALLEWLAPLWSDSGKAPAACLVEGPQPLCDVKQPFVSILSLSSLAALEKQLGRPLGTDRWRGNLWIDGWAPFAEHDMRLMTITIGGAVLRVREPIGRCPATSADSETGRLDGDMPAELRTLFGHSDFGIYAEVITGGRVALGDEVRVS